MDKLPSKLREALDAYEDTLKELFSDWRAIELKKVGKLSEKELTQMQDRVNILTEVENRFLTLINNN